MDHSKVPIERLLQIAMAVLASLGTLLLGMGQRSAALPLAVSIVAVASIYLTDVTRWFQLNRWVANLAAVAAVVFSLWDFFRFARETQLLAIANLLIYLQIVLLFEAKTIRVYWHLVMLSLLQVVVAAALNLGVLFGFLLIVYMAVAMLTLVLFFLHREAVRYGQAADLPQPADTTTPAAWRTWFQGLLGEAAAGRIEPIFQVVRHPWSAVQARFGAKPRRSAACPAESFACLVPGDMARDALDWGLVRQVIKMALGTLVFTVLLFCTVPRFGRSAWQGAGISPVSLVGFSEKIVLGELGEIAESPEEVMRVRFFDDKTDQPYPVRGEPLFRGSLLTHYDRGEWSLRTWPGDMILESASENLVRQEIVIEPLDKKVLFAVYPPVAIERNSDVIFDPRVCQLLRSGSSHTRGVSYRLGTTGFRDGRQYMLTPYTGQDRGRFTRAPWRQSPETEPPAWDRAARNLAESAEGVGNVVVHGLRQFWPSGTRRRGTQRIRSAEPAAPGDRREPADLVLSALLQFPDVGLEGLKAKADRWVRDAGVSPPDDPLATARLLERKLSDSGEFEYTLTPPARDALLDPIEDFVVNHPAGHCEYFASALALMLRAEGIPSRVVVGFKGGEWNAMGNFYQVRQLHAHAWVEAYLPPAHLPRDLPRPAEQWRNGGWLRLDPTPAGADPAAGNRWWARAKETFGYTQFLWSTYVLAMNSERQQEAAQQIVEFFKTLCDRDYWRNLFGGWTRAIRAGLRNWLDGRWFSWRGGLVAMVVSLVLVGVYRLVASAVRRTAAWVNRRRGRMARGGPARIEFYQRLEDLLARHRMVRPACQTQRNFAVAAGGQLAESAELRRVAHLPRRIADAFYRVRFGGVALDNIEAESVEHALAELAEALRAP
ncbi:MAG: transglutaminase TgpA family protein [Pirellulales bacterium]